MFKLIIKSKNILLITYLWIVSIEFEYPNSNN